MHPITSFVVSALFATPVYASGPSYIVPTGPLRTAAADSVPLPRLTPDLLANVKAFLQRFKQEPPAVQAAADSTVKMVPVQFGPLPGVAPIQAPQLPVHDYGALAAKYPSVAADFTESHLTPGQYLPLVESISFTDATYQVDQQLSQWPSDTTTVLGKNVAFLKANQSLLEEIKEIKALLPKHAPIQVQFQTVGGGGSNDLNP